MLTDPRTASPCSSCRIIQFELASGAAMRVTVKDMSAPIAHQLAARPTTTTITWYHLQTFWVVYASQNVCSQDLEALAQDILQQDTATADKLRRVEAAAARVQALQVVAIVLEAPPTHKHITQEQQAALELALQLAEDGDAAAALAAYEAQLQNTTEADAEVALARARVEAAEMAVLQARMQRAQVAEEASKVGCCRSHIQLHALAAIVYRRRQGIIMCPQEVDRYESAKAGAIAVAGGVASSAPLLLAGGVTDAWSVLASLGTVAATSALLGITYRYAVREDVQDSHIKVFCNGSI